MKTLLILLLSLAFAVQINSQICVTSAFSHATAGRPAGTVSGDFNNDGRSDIAVTSSLSSVVSILLSNGTSFSAYSSYGTGSRPISIVTKDFNNDGNLDLATANYLGNNVSVLLGNGLGGFSSATNYNVGTWPHSVKAGDFNNDGNVDLASANYSSNNVTVLLGSSSGTFAVSNSFATGTAPYCLTVADFNLDNNLDIATSNVGSNDIAVHFGSGNGNFGSGNFSAYIPGSVPVELTHADMNMDGWKDIIVSNQGANNFGILIGTGSGNFATMITYVTGSAPHGIISEKIDSDNFPDIAVTNYNSNSITIYRGLGNGSVALMGTYSSGTNPWGICSGDFNADGRSDLAAANWGSNTASVYYNQGAAINSNSTIGTCAGSPVTISASAALSYSWSTGLTSQNITVTPTTTTSYTLSSTISGCTSTAVAVVNVLPPPNIGINVKTMTVNIGNGQTPYSSFAPSTHFFLDPLPTGARLRGFTLDYDAVDQGWGGTGCNLGTYIDGIHIGSPVLSHSLQHFNYTYLGPVSEYTMGATNKLDLYFCGWGGWESFYYNLKIILLYDMPTLNVCLTNTMIPLAIGANTYTWTGGITNGVAFTPTATTTYTVLGTSTNGCASSSSITFAGIAPPIVASSGTNAACPDIVTTQSASGTAHTYSWSTGEIGTSIISLSATSTTTFNAVGVSTLTGCYAISSRTLNIMPSPTITVPSYTMCAGKTVTMFPSGAVSYTYSSGSNTVSPPSSTQFSISGTNASGCVSPSFALSNVSVTPLPTLSVAFTTTTVCNGNAITLNGSGALTHTWSGGAVNNASFIPAGSVNYTLTGTGAAGCTATNNPVSAVIVNPVPSTSVSGQSTICLGQSATLTASNADVYLWSTGASVSNIVVTPTTTTIYTLTGTNVYGCQKSTTFTVVVNPLPNVTVNSGSVCIGNNFAFIPNGASSFSYSSGSGNVTPSVTSSYTISGSDLNGCINTAVSTVTVNPRPLISVNSGSICAGQFFTINPTGALTYTISGGSFTVNPGSNSTYAISGTSPEGCTSTLSAIADVTVHALPVVSASSGTICNGQTFAINPGGAVSYSITGGQFTVSPGITTNYTLTGTSAQGCESNPLVTFVVVNPLPVISLNSGSVCAGNSHVFTPAGASTYSITGNNFTVTPGGTTSYSLTGTSAAGCLSSNTAVATVTVHALPVIGANSGSICAGQTFAILPSGAQTYSITGGTFNVSPGANSSYSVSGTSSLGCLSSSPAISNVTVHALPVVSVNSGSICTGAPFTINPSGATSYTVSGGSFVVSPISTSVFSVSGTNSFGCVTNTPALSSVTVYSLPVVSINSGSICQGGTHVFIPSGASTYTISGNNFSVSPGSSSSFILSGTSAEGCLSSNTAVGTVTVHSLPIIAASTGSICAGQSFSIVPTGAQTYTITGGSFNVSPTLTTTYSITGTSSLGCVAAAPAIGEITVHALPVISVNSGTICNGNSFTIVPSGANSYSISGGNFTVNPTSTTAFSVTGTSLMGCISASAAVSTVTVYALPVVALNSGSICLANNHIFTPSGASTYTISGNSFTVSPSGTTSYSVSGSSAAGCPSSNTAIATVTVHALPVLNVTSNSMCPGSSYIIIPSGASTYTISGGSFNVNPLSTTVYTVTGTSSVGCISQSPVFSTITIYPQPTIAVNSGSICSGDSFTISPSGAVSYSITGGNFTVNPSNTTSYSVTGSNIFGCVSINTGVSSVTVHALPVLSLNSGSICAGNNHIFSPAGASSYTITGNSFTVSPALNTTYSLTGTSSVGCAASNTAIASVTVHALPVLSVNNGSICAGNSFSIVPSGAQNYSITGGSFNVSPGTTTSYSVTGSNSVGCIAAAPAISDITVHALPVLSVNNGSICNGQSFTITPNGGFTYSITGGNFTVSPSASVSYSVTGTSSVGCPASNTVISAVTVYSLPVVSINSGTICEGENFVLTPSGALNYTVTGNSFTVNPLTTSFYSLTGASAEGCISSNTAVSTVTVFVLPVIAVNSGTICSGESFTIVPSGASSYSITGNAFVVSPVNTSSYGVTGTSTAGCVSASAAVSDITVHTLPVISVNNGSICAGEQFVIVPSGASTYSVSGGSFSVTPLNTTSYSVTATSSVGCPAANTVVSTVTVHALPVIGVNSGSICAGQNFVINASGASTYSITGNSFTVNPATTTSYSVTGTSSVGCLSSNTAVATVTVHQLPVIAVNSGSICAGEFFTITPSGASSYSITGNSFTVSPTADESYSVTGTSSVGCISGIPAIANVTVHTIPIITVNSASICQGSTLLINPSGASSYTITGGTFTVSPSQNASYSVSGTSAEGCVSIVDAVSNITVQPLPSVLAKATNTILCAGDSTNLSGSGANTYFWSGGISNNVSFIPASTTKYKLTGTDLNGCTNFDSVVVTVNNLPVVTISPSSLSGCPGETATLSALGVEGYVWSNNSTNPIIIVSPTVTTTYTVTGTDNNGCKASVAMTRTITECLAEITTYSTISNVSCNGKNDGAVILVTEIKNVKSSSAKYFWKNIQGCDDGNCDTLKNLKAGTYPVDVIITYTLNENFVVTDTITIPALVITDRGGPCDIEVFNGVTPNGDGNNDTWNIFNIEQFPQNRVSIYNRWGVKVFETLGYDNKNNVWPLPSELSKLQASTYFYIIELGNDKPAVKGWVELFKNQ